MQSLRERHPVLQLDTINREASIDGIPLALGDKEYCLLQALAKIVRTRRRPQNVTIAELLKSFHVTDY